MVLSMLVIGLWAQAPGCTKATDCKGERICEAGVCVEPGGGSGLAGSLIATGVFAMGGAFGFNLHSALHVDASGVVFTLGAGIGFGAF